MQIGTAGSVALAGVLIVTALPQEAGESRTVLVSIVAEDGRLLPALTAPNFKGEYRGEPIRVRSITRDASPRRIGLVVDSSASMARGWNRATATAEGLLSLAPDNSITILSVGDRLEQHSGLSRYPAVLRRALQEGLANEPRGPSALYDGLLATMEARSGTPAVDTVCLITDGEDTRSLSEARDVARSGAGRGIRVFVILLGDSSPLELRAPHVALRDIAETTGGLFLPLPRGESLWSTPLGRSLPATITQTYRLEVDLGREVDRPREWDLKVVDAEGNRLEHVRLTYPRWLAPVVESRE